MKYDNDSAIYKWVATLDGDFTCPGPNPALVATFELLGSIMGYGFQDSKFVCWTTVRKSVADSLDKSKVVRVLVPTGGSPPLDARYIETKQLDNGLVYHIFAPFDLS